MPILYQFQSPELQFHHTYDEIPVPAEFQTHAHDLFEIFIFLAGSGTYLVEGTSYPLHPGQLLILRPGETHMLHIDTSAPYERVALHFSPSLLNSFDPEHLLLQPFFNRPLGRKNLYAIPLDSILQALYQISAHQTPSWQSVQLAAVLFSLLSQIYQASVLPDPSEAEASSKLLQYVNQHLCEPLSLDSLARQFFMGKSQLNRTFHRLTGYSVWKYILIKRLILARSMIRQGIPAMQACTDCGFHDYSSFYRAYKNHFQLSPQEDQAELRK